MNWDKKTINTYNESANDLAEYFSGIGPRTEDIERAFALAKVDQVNRVIELGCGDGRDAAEIVKYTNWYEGVDPSIGLLNIAKDRLPNTSFLEADALSYTYPNNLDIVFAFASLLHVNINDMPAVFANVTKALRVGGVFYISLKERDTYTEEIKKDQYGERMFYYYNLEIIKKIAGDIYTTAYEDSHVHGHTNWLTVALIKR